jgi:hypothetical protein
MEMKATKMVINEETKKKEDIREQLVNEGKTGPTSHISVGEEQVTRLLGILLDLDLKQLQGSWLTPNVPRSPEEFYNKHVKHWLERHPVLRKAEVRNSGGGLHVILRLETPIELKTDQDAARWKVRAQFIQSILPTDPQQPAFGMTRPVGEINRKYDVRVTQLRSGKPVTEAELELLYQQMKTGPFQMLLKVLTGEERLEPCPLCNSGEALRCLEHLGKCYGCGTVSVGKLLSTVFTPCAKEVKHATR